MVRTSFIEIVGGACMHGVRAGTAFVQVPTPLLGGIQIAALGAAICNAFNQKVE